MNYVTYESQNNDFLKAVAKCPVGVESDGCGHLYEALLKCRPFDALLVPIQAALEVRADEIVSKQLKFEREAQNNGGGKSTSGVDGSSSGGGVSSVLPSGLFGIFGGGTSSGGDGTSSSTTNISSGTTSTAAAADSSSSTLPQPTPEQISDCIRTMLLTEEILPHHVIRLDHRYGQSFTTAAGTKGRFGDQLELVQLQGRPSVTVLRHVVPSGTCTTQEAEEHRVESLNFFLIADVLSSTDDEAIPSAEALIAAGAVTGMDDGSAPPPAAKNNSKVARRLRQAQSVLGLSDLPDNLEDEEGGGALADGHTTTAADISIKQGKLVAEQQPTTTDPPNTTSSAPSTSSSSSKRSHWGSWLMGLARSQPPPSSITDSSAAVVSSSPTPPPQEESAPDQSPAPAVAGSFTFKDFQDKMSKPESQTLVLMIRGFLDQVQDRAEDQRKKRDGSNFGGDGGGNFYSPAPCCSAAEIHELVDDCLDEMKAIPLWNNSGKDGLAAALDGLEKYVTTKLFSHLFCQDEKELMQNSQLEKRLSSLQKVITPQDLDAIDIAGGSNVKGVDTSLGRDSGDTNIEFTKAVEMLRKINNYKSPVDKVECISKCFKHIVAAIKDAEHKKKQAKEEGTSGVVSDGSLGADQLLPCFMYTVLVANPKSLLSNAKFIETYRHPSKMSGEGGYFATTLLSVTMFWLQCTGPDLRLSSEEFDSALRGQVVSRRSGELHDNEEHLPDATTEEKKSGQTDDKPAATASNTAVVTTTSFDPFAEALGLAPPQPKKLEEGNASSSGHEKSTAVGVVKTGSGGDGALKTDDLFEELFSERNTTAKTSASEKDIGGTKAQDAVLSSEEKLARVVAILKESSTVGQTKMLETAGDYERLKKMESQLKKLFSEDL